MGTVVEVCVYFLLLWGVCIFIFPSVFDYPFFILIGLPWFLRYEY